MKDLKRIILGLLFCTVTFFSAGTTISVEYRIDPSYTAVTNYTSITKLINQIYYPAGIQFKLDRVSKNQHHAPTYDLTKLNAFTKGQEGDKGIVICIVGQHTGNVIGKANLWGYFENHSRVFVDLNAVKTTQGKANMIAHEIGHLFGLEHTDSKGLMDEWSHEDKINFCSHSLGHLKSL